MIPLFKVNMPESVDQPLLAVLHSGYITQGPKVEEFETSLAHLFGSKWILSLNSGTSALTLALRLANIGPGDEVISTPMTCSATNLPILSLGGTPVWADVDPQTGLLDPQTVKNKITSKTKAIMVVDWGGAGPDLKALRKIADDYELKLIEDSAHAFGADHTKSGLADFTCFSLQAIKHISVGDGGVLICRSAADYQRGKLLRWFGINREGSSKDTRINEEITEWGYKFHMNDMNAVIGIEQLKVLPTVLDHHRALAARYDAEICSCYGKPPKNSAYWLYTLILPSEKLRDEFKDYMLANGVQVSQVHRRNDHYAVFKKYSGQQMGKWYPNHYPGLNSFSSRMICIPIHFGVQQAEANKIIHLCNEFSQKAGMK